MIHRTSSEALRRIFRSLSKAILQVSARSLVPELLRLPQALVRLQPHSQEMRPTLLRQV